MEGYWVPIIICSGFFAMVAFIAASFNRRREAEARAQAEVQTRLLEKFGSAKEFVDFLQSDGGKGFVSPLAAQSAVTPHSKILSSLKAGVIWTCVGAAALILGMTVGDEEGAVVPGAIILALGVGYLISAGLSFRLSRAWGLIPEHPGA